MAERRVIETVLAGQETISPAAKRAGKAVDDLGDEMRDTARDAEKLDREVADLEKSLAMLAKQYAVTGDKSLFGDIRKQQGELRKLLNVRKLMGDAGGDGAEAFSLSFAQRIGPLLARAPVSPPLIAAVAGASPFIAATLSAGVVAGLSAGTVAAGVAIALQDPQVKAEGKLFGTFLSDEMGRAFDSFKPATVGAMRFARKEVEGLRGELREIGDDAAAFVLPLTRGVTGFVKGVLPGIKKGLQEAGPVIAVLEQGMIRMGDAIGDAIGTIAGGSGSAALALMDLFFLVEGGIRMTAGGVRLLTDAFGLLRIATAPDKFQVAAQMEAGKTASANFQKQLEELRQKFLGVAESTGATSAAMETYEEKLRRVTDASNDAFGAHTRVGEVLDEVRDKQYKNNAGIDASTAKGRANRDMLDRLRDAFIAERDAVLAATGSQQQANAVMQRGYTAFINAADAMGLDAAAAKKLARELGLIPPSRKAQVNVETEAARREIARVKAGLNQIKSKTIWINVNTGKGSGGFTGKAVGGPVSKGQPYLVGERGPELVVPDSNGTVMTAAQTRQIMSGARVAGSAGSSGVMRHDITLRWPDGSVATRFVIDGLRRYIDGQGGNVQTVLGS